MKRVLVIVLIAIVAIGGAMPYVPVDFLKAPMERALAHGLGRKVEVDRVSLTLFSGPGVSLDGVTIYDDRRAGIEPFAYANTLDARLSLLALLRGRFEFSSLHLNDATFNLVKPDNAPWNFQMLLDQASAGGAPSALTPAAPPSIPTALPSITVRGGRINFKFAETKSVLYFDDTDLEFTPGDGGALELRFSGVPARTDRSAQNFGHFFVRGTAAPSASGQQLNLRVELEPSALDAVARLFDNSGAALKGVVALDAQLSGPSANLGVKGIIELEGAGQWRVGYQGKLDLVGQTLELDSTSPPGPSARLHVGTRDLLTTPKWEISADFLDAPLGSAFEMARKFGAPLPEKMTVEGRVAGSAYYRNTEGLGGNLEVHDAIVTLPDATPLKIPTATVFLKGNTIVAGPNTVGIAEQEFAEVGATYQTGQGGGSQIEITTRRMSIGDLRGWELGMLGAGSIPLLDRVADGSLRGSLTYAAPSSTPGAWSGDFEIQNTTMAVDGVADPVHIQSAAVSVKEGHVAVTRIRANAGPVAFEGDYRWDANRRDPEAAAPQRFHLQMAEVDLAEIERLFQPTTSREGGLLARTLRLGAAEPTPEWLKQRSAEGTVSIAGLTVADTHISITTARLAWEGASVKVSGLQGKLGDAALAGDLRLDLSGRAPTYRFDGKVADFPYKGGKLDFSGKVTAEGSGPALLASVKAEGTLRGRSIVFSPDAEFRRVAGRFEVNMTVAGPKWKLSGLELTQGSDSYSGQGATQADGKLVLDLSSGGRLVRYPAN